MSESSPARWRVRVRGIVQGVGFRPFVYGLALRLGLAGFVLNDAEGVLIEVEGPPHALAAFARALVNERPPLARVDAVERDVVAPRGDTAFAIEHSQAANKRNALIAPDTATCPDCLRELLDPADRRYRYPFINCTNCGPRFTIVADVPYDREKTTMRAFPMCADCRAEYENPLDRRFHAQPNACPVCGPTVRFDPVRDVERDTETRRRGESDRERVLVSWSPGLPDDPISQAAQHLTSGAIVAVKGLGGYHLACNAFDRGAVERLRARKHREAKPFALMVPALAAARELCLVDDDEAALLESHRRPIVLLRRRPDTNVPEALAPGHATLGLMLPYTPLHHLLLRACADLAPGRPVVLVMTSANVSDEPIAYRDDDARARLGSIADAFLLHNREILTRCDDTVTRVAVGGEQPLRRSRGYAPAPIELGFELARPILAYGAHLKNTFCLARGHQAFVSHHIGDLENVETLASLREGIVHYQRLFDIIPAAIAHDLHPEYLATKEALAVWETGDRRQETAIDERYPRLGADCQLIGVQHHHAHIASVIAEHALPGPVIGVAADGTGYGLDGAIWGCEVLVADLAGFTRAAHLAYVPLPGGDHAVRQPWRVAATYLSRVYGPAFAELDLPFARTLDRARWGVLARMIARGLNSPPTSSLGRLFDAVAALIGLRGEALYEGQAAIELETLAARAAPPYPFELSDETPSRIVVDATIAAIVEDLRRGVPADRIAGRFHATVAAFLAAACARARASSGISTVALSGGVFQNQLLLGLLYRRLLDDGFEVYTNRRVPPNDGGISLGQVAVASERIRRGMS